MCDGAVQVLLISFALIYKAKTTSEQTELLYPHADCQG